MRMNMFTVEDNAKSGIENMRLKLDIGQAYELSSD
jgi:hypothetical protein